MLGKLAPVCVCVCGCKCVTVRLVELLAIHSSMRTRSSMRTLSSISSTLTTVVSFSVAVPKKRFAKPRTMKMQHCTIETNNPAFKKKSRHQLAHAVRSITIAVISFICIVLG
jgi:hypothetical protein